jgi:hypothetical protein
MTVAQIRRIYGLTFDLDEDKKVNFTQWTHHKFVSITFMKPDGAVWRYDIKPDGTYEGEESV